MNTKLISITSIALIITILLSACDISITINPTAEPKPVNDPIVVPQDSPKPEDTPTSPPTQNIEPTSAPSHDLYAGFTENSEIPFVILHNSGESVGLSLDNQSNISDVVWFTSRGESIVFSIDSRGRPAIAVVNEDIIHYTNYTDSTVDLIIIHPDGTQDYLRTKLSSNLSNRATSPISPSFRFASYTMNDPLQLQIWNYINDGLFALEIGACVGAAGAFALNIPALAALAVACHGPLLELKIREGKAENIDVGELEAIQDALDLYGCFSGNAMDCINKFVGDMAEAEEAANQKIVNAPRPQAAPTQPKSTDKYNK